LDGDTGLLVEPGDPDAISAAIIRLLDDPDLARRFGRNGRLRLEDHFTAAAMVGSTLGLYAQIPGTIGPAPSPRPPDAQP
jgi:rhamnosyl/mannosyltransferase